MFKPSLHQFVSFVSPLLTPAVVDSVETPAPGVRQLSRWEVSRGAVFTVRVGSDRGVVRHGMHRQEMGRTVATGVWAPAAGEGQTPRPPSPAYDVVSPSELLNTVGTKILAVSLIEMSPLAYLLFARQDEVCRGPRRRLLQHLSTAFESEARPKGPQDSPVQVSALLGHERIPVMLLASVDSLAPLVTLAKTLRSISIADLIGADGNIELGEHLHPFSADVVASVETELLRRPGWAAREEAISDVLTFLLPPMAVQLHPPTVPTWQGGALRLLADGRAIHNYGCMLFGALDAVVKVKNDGQHESALTLARWAEREGRAVLEPPGELVEDAVVLPYVGLGGRADPPLVVPTNVARHVYERLLRAAVPTVLARVRMVLERSEYRAGALGDAYSMASSLAARITGLLLSDRSAFVELMDAILHLEAAAEQCPPVLGSTASELPPVRAWLKQVDRVTTQLQQRGTSLRRPANFQGFDNRMAFEISHHAVRCVAQGFLDAHGISVGVLLYEAGESHPKIDLRGLPFGVAIAMPDAWMENPFWWVYTVIHELSHAVLDATPISGRSKPPDHRQRGDAFQSWIRSVRERINPGLRSGEHSGRVIDSDSTSAGTLMLKSFWKRRISEEEVPAPASALFETCTEVSQEVVVDSMVIAWLQQGLGDATDEAKQRVWRVFWWYWLPAVLRAVGADTQDGKLGGNRPHISGDALTRLTLRVVLMSCVQNAHCGTQGGPCGSMGTAELVREVMLAATQHVTGPDMGCAPVGSAVLGTDVQQRLDWLRSSLHPPSTWDGRVVQEAPTGQSLSPPPLRYEGAEVDRVELQAIALRFSELIPVCADILQHNVFANPVQDDDVQSARLAKISSIVSGFLENHMGPLRAAAKLVEAPALSLISPASREADSEAAVTGICTETGAVISRSNAASKCAGAASQCARVEHQFLLSLANLGRWGRLDVMNKVLKPVRAGSPAEPSAGPLG